MNIIAIEDWHQQARPDPTERDFATQLGCHFEEVAEMLADLEFNDISGADTQLYKILMLHADLLKAGATRVKITDRANFLKELCDQVVTATGVAYCAQMDFPSALAEVDRSNWSKFDADGVPFRDANGKIMKGPDYSPPDLRGAY